MNIDNFQLMEDYLNGTLDQESNDLFVNRLKNEPEFEDEFKELRLLKASAKQSALLSTLSFLQETEMSIQEKETTKTEYSMKKLVSVAASLILIATVSYFTVFNTPDVATGQEIFSEYYKPYLNLSGTERGESANLSTLKSQAYNAYDVHDYTKASSLFTSLLETEKNGFNYLYAGISAMETGDIIKASENLNTVINHFKDLEAQGQWYLAMTLLNEESIEEASSSLINLALGNTSYKNRANDVLSKIGINLSDVLKDVSVVVDVKLVPDDTEEGAPDGSTSLMGRRQVQFGTLNYQGERIRFFNEYPIEGLKSGDSVEFIVYTIQKGKKENGKSFKMAFIIGKL